MIKIHAVSTALAMVLESLLLESLQIVIINPKRSRFAKPYKLGQLQYHSNPLTTTHTMTTPGVFLRNKLGGLIALIPLLVRICFG